MKIIVSSSYQKPVNRLGRGYRKRKENSNSIKVISLLGFLSTSRAKKMRLECVKTVAKTFAHQDSLLTAVLKIKLLLVSSKTWHAREISKQTKLRFSK
jgi:hypothetical protein